MQSQDDSVSIYNKFSNLHIMSTQHDFTDANKLIKYPQHAFLYVVPFMHAVPFMGFACRGNNNLINVGQMQAVKDGAPVMRHIID